VAALGGGFTSKALRCIGLLGEAGRGAHGLQRILCRARNPGG
jgi:hypothetical protein